MGERCESSGETDWLFEWSYSVRIAHNVKRVYLIAPDSHIFTLQTDHLHIGHLIMKYLVIHLLSSVWYSWNNILSGFNLMPLLQHQNLYCLLWIKSVLTLDPSLEIILHYMTSDILQWVFFWLMLPCKRRCSCKKLMQVKEQL